MQEECWTKTDGECWTEGGKRDGGEVMNAGAGSRECWSRTERDGWGNAGEGQSKNAGEGWMVNYSGEEQ